MSGLSGRDEEEGRELVILEKLRAELLVLDNKGSQLRWSKDLTRHIKLMDDSLVGRTQKIK